METKEMIQAAGMRGLPPSRAASPPYEQTSNQRKQPELWTAREEHSGGDQRGAHKEKVEGRIKNHLRGSKRSLCGQIYDVGRDKGDVSGRPAPMENGNKSIKAPKIDTLCNCFVLGTRRLGAKCSPTIQSTSGYLCVMCARGPTESERMRRNG